ncbi:MAG: hypothetical protein QNJ98_04320 [Planctomycetota bacterium]|nr:hypothetical protein [Planctomycetota bacterium]
MILAGFLDVFSIVIGVIVTLTGMALVLLGLIATSEKAVKQGLITTGVALGLIAGGLWLIGVF